VKAPADELAAGNAGFRRANVVLDQPCSVDRRFLLRHGLEIGLDCLDREEKLYAQSLAAAVGLENEGAMTEVSGRGQHLLAAHRRHRARGPHADSLQRGILGQLAGFEAKRPVVIHHPPAVALEPGQHETGKLRSVAVVPGVGRGAHAIVKDTLRRTLIEGHGPFVQEPFLMGQSELLEGGVQRLHPRLVLVQHVDPAHAISPMRNVK